MKKLSLQGRFFAVLSVQVALILLLWFSYHSIATSTIKKQATENANLTANAILLQISDEFNNMKQASATIAGSTSVQDFLCEQDVTLYYERATSVSEVIEKIAYPISGSDSLILINSQGQYYRFSGSTSNASCELLYDSFKDSGSVFTVVGLDDTLYFCHAGPVLSAKAQPPMRIGNIIILTGLAKTRRLLETDHHTDVDTAVILHNKVLLSNLTSLEGTDADDLDNQYSSVIFADIADTGLQVAACVRGDTARTARNTFFVISLAMITLFMLTFALMYRYLLTGMIRPMSAILQDVSKINTGRGRLPATGRTEFDELVDGVNAMLNRTESYHMGLLNRQIDAHFVVNALTSIQALAERGEVVKTQRSVSGLGYLLKHMHAGDAPTNIFAEMEALEQYISLMNIRHNEKFIVEYEVDDRLSDYCMPGLILQPIVENALTHGLQSKTDQCRLLIVGKLDNSELVFTITDNGAGMLPAQLDNLLQKITVKENDDFLDPELQGVALANIQKRIELQYGADFGIEISSTHNIGTTVTIRLPAILDDFD